MDAIESARCRRLTSGTQPASDGQPNPDALFHLGFGFAKARILSAAVELDLFTLLSEGGMTAAQISKALGLKHRAVDVFLDGLVSLDALSKTREKYACSDLTNYYFNRRSEAYIGGLFKWLANRVALFWNDLPHRLREGGVSSEARVNGDLFGQLHTNPASLEIFCEGMTGLSLLPAQTLASRFEWRNYQTVLDVGAAEGGFCGVLARAHPHLRISGFDLPALNNMFHKHVAEHNLGDPGRVKFIAGDFFRDPFPDTDVLVFGHILHDWSIAVRKRLIRQAYNALPPGGALIVYDMMKDGWRENDALLPLLMDLHMALVTPEGGEYTQSECRSWLQEAGFARIRLETLSLVHAALIAYK